jgi:hypothetical protein
MKTEKQSTLMKVNLLSFGVRFDVEALEGVGTIYKEDNRGYDDSNWRVPKGLLVPSEMMLPGNIVVCTHIRPDSPYLVMQKGEQRYITEDGKIVSPVSFLPRPRVWSQASEDETDMKSIVSFYGHDCLNINLYSGCKFWEVNKPCKFCSVGPTQKRFGVAKIRKTVADVDAAAKAAFSSRDPINFILTTAGCLLDADLEVVAHIEALHAIRKYAPWHGTLRGNVSLMPPKDFSLIDRLHETGIEHPGFNLEVWGQSAFSEVCPGKQEYRGYEHILDAYRYAVEVFGRGMIWCNFVAGLQDLDVLKEGFTKMAEIGVVPGANVFHPDMGAHFSKRKAPSPEYIIELYRHAARLYHRFDYQPFFSESVHRSSIANEAYKGWV